MKTIHIIAFLFFMGLCFPLPSPAEIIVQTGVASPQSEREQKDTEQLRERALNNAMHLSGMQVCGPLITVETADTSRSEQRYENIGQNATEQSMHQSNFHRKTVSRTSAFVRLKKIIKEWRENGQYYVKAEFVVDPPEKMAHKLNAGYFWERVGKPSIRLKLMEKDNGKVNSPQESPTLSFFRDNLVDNGITPSANGTADIQYLVNISEDFKTNHVASFDTYSTSCRLSFQIVDQNRQETVAEYRKKSGPEPGFSVEQSREGCIKSIAPDVSETLLREIAAIMNDRWNNGTEFDLVIEGIPGRFVTNAKDMVNELFQVNGSADLSYRDNRMSIAVTYKRGGADLAKAVEISFAEMGWTVAVYEVMNNKVSLHWINQK